MRYGAPVGVTRVVPTASRCGDFALRFPLQIPTSESGYVVYHGSINSAARFAREC